MAFQSKIDDLINVFSVCPEATMASVAKTANRATNESLFVNIEPLTKCRANCQFALAPSKSISRGTEQTVDLPGFHQQIFCVSLSAPLICPDFIIWSFARTWANRRFAQVPSIGLLWKPGQTDSLPYIS